MASSMAGMSDFESMRAEDVPEGVQLVDVREANEFAEWHAKGAENLPCPELQLRYGELDLDQTCTSFACPAAGRRACQWLELNGIDAINVSNGSIGWRDAGRTIIVNGEETTNPPSAGARSLYSRCGWFSAERREFLYQKFT